ncbi:hypothetical protein M3936_11810 [Sutcliffiella horikoshii]|uniref:hypothetical protein n=1 Tax=Sutcliffiella horikoshii TaxID=79883 RepID=UPI00203E359E|nr:hypothetical protein [Sutcliffiella horikoshii]MCM3618264.1 hypothetical protein [Sutcliffiella horikoshii]
MTAKVPSVKYYVVMSSLICLFIILQSIVVVYTPHTFVKVMNLISIIGASGIVGAFIRDVFILKEKETQVMEK